MFGEKIKALRKEKGISQRKLAEEMHVIQASVAQWETDKADPHPINIKALAIYFDVTTDFLFGLEDESGRRTNIIGTITDNHGTIIQK